MNKFLIFIALFITSVSFSQELKLQKATSQKINHGASPTSTTTYTVTILKNKKFNWQIDSVVSISSAQQVKYNIVKVDNPDAVSPKYEQVKKYNKCDKGNYQITFSITKSHGGSSRPGAPQNQMADTTNIEGGVIIYYRVNGKTKKIKVESFEQLETINAP
jgi:hypothetical protein